MIIEKDDAFNVVFEGHFADGHDPIAAQAAFAKRFGDSAAGKIFSQKRAILKRDVTQEEARRMRGVLAEVGILVALTPVDTTVLPKRRSSGATSMVERAAERARARRARTAVKTAATITTPHAPAAVAIAHRFDGQAASASETPPEESARSGTRSRKTAVAWFLLMSVVALPLCYAAFNYGGW